MAITEPPAGEHYIVKRWPNESIMYRTSFTSSSNPSQFILVQQCCVICTNTKSTYPSDKTIEQQQTTYFEWQLELYVLVYTNRTHKKRHCVVFVYGIVVCVQYYNVQMSSESSKSNSLCSLGLSSSVHCRLSGGVSRSVSKCCRFVIGNTRMRASYGFTFQSTSWTTNSTRMYTKTVVSPKIKHQTFLVHMKDKLCCMSASYETRPTFVTYLVSNSLFVLTWVGQPSGLGVFLYSILC